MVSGVTFGRPFFLPVYGSHLEVRLVILFGPVAIDKKYVKYS